MVFSQAVVLGADESGNLTRIAMLLKKGFFVFPGRPDTIKSCIYVEEPYTPRQCLKRAENYTGLNASYPECPTLEKIVTTLQERYFRSPSSLTCPDIGEHLLLFRVPLPERIATTDWFHDAAGAAQQAGFSFYLLGGIEDTNRTAYEKMQAKYPRLNIVGRRNGYFSEAEEQEVLADIRATKPDVLWVGLGRPKQEEFCIRNREALKGVTWMKTCGGLFDFLADDVVRAPNWMQAAGFEWLWRMIQEPRRLFWRYLTTNLHATWLMWRHTHELPPRDPGPPGV